MQYFLIIGFHKNTFSKIIKNIIQELSFPQKCMLQNYLFCHSEQSPKGKVEESPANLRFLSAKGGSAFGGHYVPRLLGGLRSK